ncbi:MAG: transposase, partial [Planctomycetaceae bacterium]|nr:transposase [Planctomycetaceae bacterium]
MIVVHRIALDPNQKQETYFRQAAGCARFAYNWALAEWQKQYEAGGKPNEAALRRLLNANKAEKFPWLLEISKAVIQQAIKNLGTAYAHFFRRLEEYRHEPDPRRKKRLGKKLGYPKFKKKGRCRDAFRTDNGTSKERPDAVRVDGVYVVLPKIGRIRMRERLRFAGRVKSAVVSRTADRWFVSLSVEVPDAVLPRKNHAVVGVDLGIATLATVSDGRDPYEAPRPLKTLAQKRRRLGKALARKQGPGPGKKPSKNFLKAKRRLARLEARIANIRLDATHKATTDLCRTCAHIVLEDLSVQGLLANHKLANALADVGFAEFRRQVEYKATRYACKVEFAPRSFPSSKMCFKCGYVNDNLKLSDRIWTCPACGTTHD